MEQFLEILGHSVQKKNLERVLKKRCVPHAMLFCGPDGVGKKTLAFSMAKVLLLEANENDDKRKEILGLVAAGNHPDLHLISLAEGKRDITVESVRHLCTQLRLRPYYGRAKVAIIDNAHRLSIAASNALLMTLEEPAKHSFIILVTHAEHRLPETIISRCQKIHFGFLSDGELEQVLLRALPELKDREDLLKVLLSFAAGSLSALGLDTFFENSTFQILDEEKALKYLGNLVVTIETIKSRIATIWENHADSGIALSAAIDFLSDENDPRLFWTVFLRLLRQKLQTSDLRHSNFWAQLINDAVLADKLILERNLNPQLHLSSLLLRELRS